MLTPVLETSVFQRHGNSLKLPSLHNSMFLGILFTEKCGRDQVSQTERSIV